MRTGEKPVRGLIWIVSFGFSSSGPPACMEPVWSAMRPMAHTSAGVKAGNRLWNRVIRLSLVGASRYSTSTVGRLQRSPLLPFHPRNPIAMLLTDATPSVTADASPASQVDADVLVVPLFSTDDALDDVPGLDDATGGAIGRARASGAAKGMA